MDLRELVSLESGNDVFFFSVKLKISNLVHKPEVYLDKGGKPDITQTKTLGSGLSPHSTAEIEGANKENLDIRIV